VCHAPDLSYYGKPKVIDTQVTNGDETDIIDIIARVRVRQLRVAVLVIAAPCCMLQIVLCFVLCFKFQRSCNTGFSCPNEVVGGCSSELISRRIYRDMVRTSTDLCRRRAEPENKCLELIPSVFLSVERRLARLVRQRLVPS